MDPALSGRGDGERGWQVAELCSRQLPWDSALNPEPSASPFSLLLFIFLAKSLCAPAPKQKADRPGSDTAFGSPHALRMPVHMLAHFVFSPPHFVIQICGSFCASAFNPRVSSCLSRIEKQKVKSGWVWWHALAYGHSSISLELGSFQPAPVCQVLLIQCYMFRSAW